MSPLRRANARLFFGGSEAKLAAYKLNVMPKIVGSGFMLSGSAALVTGIVRLFLAS